MKKRVGLFVALAIFCLQLVMLPYAGMTWDEPASFFIGRANLNFWMTGNRAYLTDLQNKELFVDSPFYFVSGEEYYPPFPFLVSSAVSYILAERMHIMHFIDAHHLGEVALGAIGVWAMWGIAGALGLSLPAAAGATLAYALYPTVVGQMRSDAKDIPLVSMLLVAVYFFLAWIKAWGGRDHKKSIRLAVGWATAFGISQATKPSAVIMAPIIGAWLVAGSIVSGAFRKKTLKPAFWVALVTFALVAVVMFVFLWPWLWDDPMGKLATVWGFFKVVGFRLPVLYLGKLYHAGVDLPKAYPFGILLFQTPIELTVLAILGLGVSVYRYVKVRDPFAILPVLWFGLGIGRFFLPNVLIYAKVRHFIDAMPGFFLLIGFGLDFLVSCLMSLVSRLRHVTSNKRQGIQKAMYALLIGVIVLHEAVIIAEFFPYEPSYFNFLVGNSKTVANKGLFDVEYWASGLKEAMEYITLNAKSPTSVYTCQLRHIAMYYRSPVVSIRVDRPEEADYVVLPNSPSWFGWQLAHSQEHHTLVYTVKRNGADLYYVFRNSDRTGIQCLPETLTTYE